MGEQATFGVLVVCAANQCRSPLAEHLLRAELGERGIDWTVGSAGVRATPGVPVYPPVLDYLAHRGIDASGHRSRPVDDDLVAAADLVLTAEAEHRAVIATRFPTAVSRTFTLLQFARFARWVDEHTTTWLSSGPELMEQIAIARTQVPSAPRTQDLGDPVGRSRRAMRRCEREVEAAVTAILGPLGSSTTRIMKADDGASY